MPDVSSLSSHGALAGDIPVLTDRPRESTQDRWGWIELFAAIQILWGALLFIPGVQPYRIYIRALPYVASLGALVFAMRRSSGEPLPASSRWLLASFALLAASLLHADTHLKAGLAQLVFQISIAAPMFWVARSVRSPERLARLLGVIFAASLCQRRALVSCRSTIPICFCRQSSARWREVSTRRSSMRCRMSDRTGVRSFALQG